MDTVDQYDVTILGDPIYQGEGKWFKFSFTKDGETISLVGADFSFAIKRKISDDNFIYQAEDSVDFDDTSLEDGIVRVNLPASVTSTMESGTYYGELTTILIADSDVDKKLVKFKVRQAVDPGGS